ncbi:hypothetical protein PHLGIDRAFT_70274 [Phlebiopsis gigantea 11061_1 CR5-6]|uniref:Protein kinase domain-containing protein n=1 Tax=Phlebiopsis gigantea (strain 11061_1 CR5-6) TaxID=745531 RepID=A0A0C3S927_PHLG1|nr:hypothetical protein PHLGIDRAFT_70274 [Phlebiopsis gigantea 11061_1 CR5-6]
MNTKLKQIAEGLTYIHGEYMAHGDLRGKNVLVTADENVMIADFGLTVYVESSNEALRSTCRGNPRWTAPELASDSTHQSVRPTYAADIYSFAMVCFEVGERWNIGA